MVSGKVSAALRQAPNCRYQDLSELGSVSQLSSCSSVSSLPIAVAAARNRSLLSTGETGEVRPILLLRLSTL
jgi:hypothetical protein